MTTRFNDHLLTGNHAGRPAFGDVPQGTLYACTTHALIYQSDGATAWTTWATMGVGDSTAHIADASDAHDASAVSFSPTGTIAATDVQAAIAEVATEAGSSAPTLPTFVAAGTSATGTGDITPILPTGHTTNDILLLFVQSGNQAVTAPAGWTKLGPVVGIGTAAAAAATRLTAFWKRHDGSETDPTVTDTGDHTLAQIIAIRGCVTTGDPFISVGQTRKTTASTTGTADAGATHVDACLVINAFAHSLDSATAVFSSWTNADLANVTERVDVATADGNGGGIGVATGEKALAGPFAATTVTETSTVDVSSTFYMIPAGLATAGAIDRQVFINTSDIWTKPTGAKHVEITAIGGGASGSAGRNAATAAGGGGGGGGAWSREVFGAALLANGTIAVGAGGAATANSDGAASNVGAVSTVSLPATLVRATEGYAATASASGAGGAGGAGGGAAALGGAAAGAATVMYATQSANGGTGGTTAAGGSRQADFGGGGGAGGGTSQAASAGGDSRRGGGGGGGGRSNTNVGTGGSGGWFAWAGGATAGANGTDSTVPELGGGGGAGGTSAAGPGGAGGWPGGGGGGGGSQSGAQRGGAGADGVVVIVTHL